MTQPKVMPKLSAGDPASVILPQSKPTTGRSKPKSMHWSCRKQKQLTTFFPKPHSPKPDSMFSF